MIKEFEGDYINVIVEGNRLLFNTDHVASAVGYSSTRSLNHHIKGTKYDILGNDGNRYVTRDGLSYLAGCARRTPAMARISDWAFKIKKDDIAPKVPVASKLLAKAVDNDETLYGIKEVAIQVGMSSKEFSDWLVDKGYAGRYESNNALYWKQWFRDQKYGTRPIIKDLSGERESNVSKLTLLGLGFIKNRLNSERESSVLSFAKKEASEFEKLEQEVEALIKTTFESDIADKAGVGIWGVEAQYMMGETELIKKVKGIIAQVKLKEKKT